MMYYIKIEDEIFNVPFLVSKDNVEHFEQVLLNIAPLKELQTVLYFLTRNLTLIENNSLYTTAMEYINNTYYYNYFGLFRDEIISNEEFSLKHVPTGTYNILQGGMQIVNAEVRIYIGFDSEEST